MKMKRGHSILCEDCHICIVTIRLSLVSDKRWSFPRETLRDLDCKVRQQPLAQRATVAQSRQTTALGLLSNGQNQRDSHFILRGDNVSNPTGTPIFRPHDTLQKTPIIRRETISPACGIAPRHPQNIMMYGSCDLRPHHPAER